MPEQKIITASLEGMRVLVDEKRCELQEYDFVTNTWLPKEVSPWPLPRERADEWLAGWNDLDRFTAVSALIEPLLDPRDRTGATTRLQGPRL